MAHTLQIRTLSALPVPLFLLLEDGRISFGHRLRYFHTEILPKFFSAGVEGNGELNHGEAQAVF